MASILFSHIRQFCRGCLSNSNLTIMRQIRIVKPESVAFDVYETFLGLSGVEKFSEPFAPMICESCLDALDTIIRFRRNAIDADEALNSLLLPTGQATVKMEDASTQTTDKVSILTDTVKSGKIIITKEFGVQTEDGCYDNEPYSAISVPLQLEYHSSTSPPTADYTLMATTSAPLITVVEPIISPMQLLLCYVCHINSPNNFFVHFDHNSDRLGALTQTLSEIELEPLAREQIQNGAPCVARYPIDGCFYRAEILSVLNDGRILVTFTDYGNTSSVDDLRQLPVCMRFPHLSVQCRLDLPDGRGWAKEATGIFARIVENGETQFECQLLERGERCRVNLRLNGANIIDHLLDNPEPCISSPEALSNEVEDTISECVAYNADDAYKHVDTEDINAAVCEEASDNQADDFQPQPPSVNEEESENIDEGNVQPSSPEHNKELLIRDDSTGTSSVTEEGDKAQVVSVNSIDDFHVTIHENLEDLAKICYAMINDGHTFEKLTDPPSLNSIVATFFEGHFYRAIVLSGANAQGGCYVELIDFGHTIVCYEFCKLPENLVDLPALAIRCRLAIGSEKIWTVPMAERFRALCLSEDWFDIRVVDAEDRIMTVELYLSGRSVTEIIEEEFSSVAN